MNPELLRNLWLEIAPARLAFMAGAAAIIVFGVLALPNTGVSALGPLGEFAFFVVVIIWGSRNAARAIIGEVRERTWDFQRLSSIRPAAMTIGKLYGATSFVWFGGLIAFALILASAVNDGRTLDGIHRVLSLVLVGLLAHAVAIGSALLSARRRRSDARVAILPHQFAGLAAAAVAGWLGTSLNVLRLGSDQLASSDLVSVTWWGVSLPLSGFYMASTFAFVVFATLGAWRLMRLELMMTNAPLVWPAFLGFLTLWVIGLSPVESLTAGLVAAYVIVHLTTAFALVVEPKSLVDVRAWTAAVRRLDLGRALALLPAYGWGFLFAAGLAIALQFHTPNSPIEGLNFDVDWTLWRPWIAISALGFLARDIGVFLFFHAGPRQRRADAAAIVVLALLYLIAAPVAAALVGETARGVFVPSATAPAIVAVAPWLEAALVWFVTAGRLALINRAVTRDQTLEARSANA